MVNSKRPKIRAVIADDHGLVRTSMKRLLESTREIEVVEEAETGEQAIALVPRVSPDILILDIQMPELGGLEVIRQLDGAVPILVVTGLVDAEFARRTISSGATGFITKTSSAKERLAAVREVASGRTYVSVDLKKDMAEQPPQVRNKDDLVSSLSEREFQIMLSLAQGLSNREIAEQLSINIKTVDSHRGHILKKLHVKNNADLTRFAIRNGLVQL